MHGSHTFIMCLRAAMVVTQTVLLSHVMITMSLDHGLLVAVAIDVVLQ